MKKIIPVIVGPTCSGKSDLGIAIAHHFNGEIINLDSVQLHKGLYVATAKVPIEEQQGIHHHLIDIAEPTENFTAGQYIIKAQACITHIESLNKLPILVGGTGFYLNALRGQLFEQKVPTDFTLRSKLNRIIQQKGSSHLHKILQRIDPVSAKKLFPNDWSRITRALEVFFQTGQSISKLQLTSLQNKSELSKRMIIFVLNPPREILYEKINHRVEIMERKGLLQEVEALISDGIPLDAKAFMAHGYRRIIEYLQGTRSYDSAIEQMKIDTRHYAKRQLTWWRREPEAIWINGFGNDLDIHQTVIEKISHASQIT